MPGTTSERISVLALRRRTPCRTYAQTLSDFPSTGVRKLADRKFRTHGRTLPQQVSEKSEIDHPTTSNTGVGVVLKWCPDCPESLQKCNFSKHDAIGHRRRTSPQQVSEKSEIDHRTPCRTLPQALSDFPSTGVRKSSDRLSAPQPSRLTFLPFAPFFCGLFER